MSKLKKLFLRPSMILIALDHRGIIRLNDKLYLKIVFRDMMGYRLNLKNPETFNEKMQWLKLYDRKSHYTQMVDKAAVKEYVGERIGWQFIIPSIGVYNSFEDIDFSSLPNRFVLKCTHDSGSAFVCKDKKKFLDSDDFLKTRDKFKKLLKKNYYYLWREWPYKNVKPRLLVEQYMEDIGDGELRDYKFFCFNGKVKMMFVATNRQGKGDTCFDFFDRDFNHLPFLNGHPNADVMPHKPKAYNKMVELAEKLSTGIPHIRVDFYEANGKIYFGELTFYHWSGLTPFNPEIWDKKIGDLIKLPKKEGHE